MLRMGGHIRHAYATKQPFVSISPRTSECVLIIAASTQNVVNCSHATLSFAWPNPEAGPPPPLFTAKEGVATGGSPKPWIGRMFFWR